MSEPGRLTNPRDWDEYHDGLDVRRLDERARNPTIFDEFIDGKRGAIFELGCGGSAFLVRSALAGWQVGGIDFSPASLQPLREFLEMTRLGPGYFIEGDVFDAPIGLASEQFDLLVSAGFLEHFEDPVPILERWAGVLKPSGLVVSAIPNLHSINARIFERFDPAFWRQHVPFSPAELDRMHRSAGLEPVRPAAYIGHYDIHMLIPWEKIAARFPHPQIYRAFKLATYFGLGVPLKHLPLRPGRRLSPYVLGVYRRGTATAGS